MLSFRYVLSQLLGNFSIAQWSFQNRLLVCFSVWSTRFSFDRLLQFIKATDNFPEREEAIEYSAGLLGAVFVFLL